MSNNQSTEGKVTEAEQIQILKAALNVGKERLREHLRTKPCRYSECYCVNINADGPLMHSCLGGVYIATGDFETLEKETDRLHYLRNKKSYKLVEKYAMDTE